MISRSSITEFLLHNIYQAFISYVTYYTSNLASYCLQEDKSLNILTMFSPAPEMACSVNE